MVKNGIVIGDTTIFNPFTNIKSSLTLPFKYMLHQNYPNPFNPSTTISFSLHKPEKVELKVFDLLGREVAFLLNGYKPAGEHKVEFDGSNLSSGIYFYRLQTGIYSSVKKMILMK